MNKLIKAVGGPKIAILLAVVLAALVLFLGTVSSHDAEHSVEETSHGHSHD